MLAYSPKFADASGGAGGATCIRYEYFNATIDQNLPDCPSFNTTNIPPGVWYNIVGTGDDLLEVGPCDRGGFMPSEYFVFQGDCDALTCVETKTPGIVPGQPSDGGQDKELPKQWLTEEGVTYRVLVVQQDLAPNSNFVDMTILSIRSPTNGKCEAAVMHPGDGSMVTGPTLVAGPVPAQTEQSLAQPDCLLFNERISSTTPAVWYTVIGTGEPMLADTCYDESEGGTHLKVFAASACSTHVGCEVEVTVGECRFNDFAFGPFTRRVAWDSVQGEKYYVKLTADYLDFLSTFENYGLTIGSFVAPLNDHCNDTQIAESINEQFDGTQIGATLAASDTAVQGTCVDDALQAVRLFPYFHPFVAASAEFTTWHTVMGTGNTLVAELLGHSLLTAVMLVYEGTCNDLVCPDGLEFSSPEAIALKPQSRWKSVAGRKYFVVVTIVGPPEGTIDINMNWQNNYNATIREEEDDEDTGPICFPGDSIVDVRNKGLIRLDKLQIGDYARVGSGDTFDRVYSFGHKDESKIAKYLRIHVEDTETPLILSGAHMVFVTKALAVPASSLGVGDKVLTQTGDLGVIIKIEKVRRRGIYAPFTMAGSIVVNGIVASSYVSLQEVPPSHKLIVGGTIETPLTMQWLAHIVQVPHRLLCRVNWDYFCREETYTDSGLSWSSAGALAFAQWLIQLDGVLMVVIGVPTLLVLMMFAGTEVAVQYLGLHHFVGLFMIGYFGFFRHRTKALLWKA